MQSGHDFKPVVENLFFSDEGRDCGMSFKPKLLRRNALV